MHFTNCTYLLSSERNIGAKRNQCCRLASGDYIAHFDSDDWSAPNRLTDQVNQLEASGKPITGYGSMLFYVELPNEHPYYLYSHRKLVVGTSLMYSAKWWDRNRFKENTRMNVEDSPAIMAALHAGELHPVDGLGMMVARAHGGSTSRKHLEGAEYRKVTREAFPEAFFG